jgi:hypothetical protein
MKFSALAWLSLAMVALVGSAQADILVYQGTLKGTKAGADGTGSVNQGVTMVLDNSQTEADNFVRLIILETVNGTKTIKCQNISDTSTILSLLGASNKPYVGLLVLDQTDGIAGVEASASGILGAVGTVKLDKSTTIQAAKTLKGSQLDNSVVGGSRAVSSGAVSLKLNTKETLSARAAGATVDSVSDALVSALAAKNKITNPANISCD